MAAILALIAAVLSALSAAMALRAACLARKACKAAEQAVLPSPIIEFAGTLTPRAERKLREDLTRAMAEDGRRQGRPLA